MARRILLESGSWQCDLQMTITILDEKKFEREAELINKFWCSHEWRAEHHGGHVKAGLALFAKECFEQIAFNNFKSESWLREQFDWSQGKGIEGFPSLDDFGVTINSIEPWFIDDDDITVTELED